MKELLSWITEHFYPMLVLACIACLVAIIFFVMHKKFEGAISLFLSLVLTIISIAGVPKTTTDDSPSDTLSYVEETQTGSMVGYEANQVVQPDINKGNEQLDTPPSDDTSIDRPVMSTPQSNVGTDIDLGAIPELDHSFPEEGPVSEMNRCKGFSLTVYSTWLRLKTLDGNDVQHLGGIASRTSPITVFLIENDTKTVIETKQIQFGESVDFTINQDGLYYYQVSCEGYQTFFSDTLINFRNSDADDAEMAAWSVSLEKQGATLLEPFTIELHDSTGKPLSGVEFLVWAEDLVSGCCTEAYTLHTVDGLLTSWHSEDGVDYYEPVSFQLLDGYKLVARPNGEYVSFSAHYPADVEVNIG